MSHNLPRKPVHFVPENQELLKAQEGLAGQRPGSTDFSEDQAYAQISRPTATYRTPPDRMIGNQFFRRYVDGRLDVEYAVGKVVDALHRVKDSGGVDQLNGEEKVVLGVLFPSQFSVGSEPVLQATAMVQQRLSMAEVELIRQAVAAHLAEELNYSGGQGGGSVPGRHQTRF